MKLLYRCEEAVEKFFDGDSDALRQAMIFNGLRALVEYRGEVEHDETDLPWGDTAYAKWRTMGDGKCMLTGWFYVDADYAARWVANPSDLPATQNLWASEDSGVPFYGDFVTPFPVTHCELWFTASDLHTLTAPMKLLPAEVPGAEQGGKRLSTRERNNLLRIIAGLAKHCSIDLAEGGKGTLQIEAAVAGAGFDGPKEKTIRDVLTQVRELD